MSISPQAKAGISGNIDLALRQTIEIMQKVDPHNTKSSSTDLLVKQTAVQTVVLAAIAQLLLANIEETVIVSPH